MKVELQNQIELLAPAKDLDCGISAIKCGADAVYIGGPSFSARANAGNNLKDIEKLVQFAHFYKCKVYIALNTIFFDGELKAVQNLIKQLCAIGADALIIQDMGILELDIPPIKLIASTQTHNNAIEKILFLEKAGFSRVILARELSLSEIQSIKHQTNVELEVFIHGALCVSYSGQCYLSYAIGHRSGNRGECAQPCRNLYNLMTKTGKVLVQNKHLLSLKDLNLSYAIPKLIDSGISSFKIEGRLKDVLYIKNIVSFYRQILDSKLEDKKMRKSSFGKTFFNFIPDPAKTFNRGYTDYFIEGRKRGISSWDTPKFKGEKMGTVKTIERDYITLNAMENISISAGDGVCFFNQENILSGTLINKVAGDRIYPENIYGIKKNTEIFRNIDFQFIKTLNHSKIERKLGITLFFRENEKGFSLRVVDEEGLEYIIEKSLEKTIADNVELAYETVNKQLSRVGNTGFYIQEIILCLKQAYFIRVSQLNELRRDALEGLLERRKNSYEKNQDKIIPNTYPYPVKQLDYRANVLNQKARDFYSRHGVKAIDPAAESGIKMAGKQVMTTKYCILFELGECKKNKEIAECEDLYLEDVTGHKLQLKHDCNNCQMEIYF